MTAAIETAEQRATLPARKQPYYQRVRDGLWLGYRKTACSHSWVVRLHHPNQGRGYARYISERIGSADDLDYDAAMRALWERMSEREKNPLPADRANADRITVEQAIELYLRGREAEGKDTNDARRTFRAFVIPRWGDHRVASLRAADLRIWRDELASLPPRARRPMFSDRIAYTKVDMSDPDVRRRRRVTANRVTAIFKAALNALLDLYPDKLNPQHWQRGMKPFQGVERPADHWLTQDQARRLINACEPDFRDLVMAALFTGARYSELCRLRVNDYEPDARRLRISQSKTGQPRHILLSIEAGEFFDNLTAGRLGNEVLLQRIVTEYDQKKQRLIPVMTEDQHGNKVPLQGAWGSSHQHRRMKQACARAKIKPRIGFHGLRHTYISLAIQGGMNSIAVARNVGHRDTKMIERVYGHLSDDYRREQVDQFAPRYGVPTANKKVASIEQGRAGSSRSRPRQKAAKARAR